MKYGEKEIKKAKIETWPDKNGRDYIISVDLPEFTCLCPRSGYPDFALIKIRYIPGKKIAELRSLKLYINKFRNIHISHEDAVNKVLNDLAAALKPKWIEVEGEFNPRGNVNTVVTVRYAEKGFKFPEIYEKADL